MHAQRAAVRELAIRQQKHLAIDVSVGDIVLHTESAFVFGQLLVQQRSFEHLRRQLGSESIVHETDVFPIESLFDGLQQQQAVAIVVD